ncbi:hypothetical protein TA3x_000092 [Tundrisphaera sp. TA3]|uniref:hypothetical protein n=1 Tax=Tundrisphaera sp. TA3 TaxID=3435775 RepID=UPI003EBFB870
MPYILEILVNAWCPFTPIVSDSTVMVDFVDTDSEGGAINLDFRTGMASGEITQVMHALLRFFQGEHFRSADFEKGELLVRKEERGEVSLVKYSGGYLCEDGTVAFPDSFPHK